MVNKKLKSDFEKVMIAIVIVAILHFVGFLIVNLKH
jgi:cell division protein FtsL